MKRELNRVNDTFAEIEERKNHVINKNVFSICLMFCARLAACVTVCGFCAIFSIKLSID